MGQADKLIRVAQSYLGTSQWSDDHLAMVDAYNSVSPIPVGYAVQYSDDWCDIFVTVCGDEAGISHLIGRERPTPPSLVPGTGHLVRPRMATGRRHCHLQLRRWSSRPYRYCRASPS